MFFSVLALIIFYDDFSAVLRCYQIFPFLLNAVESRMHKVKGETAIMPILPLRLP